MSTNNKSIHFLRKHGVNSAILLDDGQPFYNKQKNYLTIGVTEEDAEGNISQKNTSSKPITVREVIAYESDDDTSITDQTCEEGKTIADYELGSLKFNSTDKSAVLCVDDSSITLTSSNITINKPLNTSNKDIDAGTGTINANLVKASKLQFGTDTTKYINKDTYTGNAATATQLGTTSTTVKLDTTSMTLTSQEFSKGYGIDIYFNPPSPWKAVDTDAEYAKGSLAWCITGEDDSKDTFSGSYFKLNSGLTCKNIHLYDSTGGKIALQIGTTPDSTKTPKFKVQNGIYIDVTTEGNCRWYGFDANGIHIGDDAVLYDCGEPGTVVLKSKNDDSPGIRFIGTSENDYGTLHYTGTNFHITRPLYYNSRPFITGVLDGTTLKLFS